MGEHGDAARLGALAPALRQEDLFEINKTFPAYLFRRRKTREIWTSCCGRYEILPKNGLDEAQAALLAAEHKAEPHGYPCHTVCALPKKLTSARCPWCGRVGTIKELGRCGRRDNLAARRRCVVFRWDGTALWGIACYTTKLYGGDEAALTAMPGVSIHAIYRFTPGCAERAKRWGKKWEAYARFDVARLRSRGQFSEPFGWSAEMGMGYDLTGRDEIQKSPFRWCQSANFSEHSVEMMRFSALCTVYPRQVEMLMKSGMWSVVKDLVEDGKTNKAAFNWSQTDPRKAFGLDGGELKAFLAGEHELSILIAYKRAKKKGILSPMEDWARLWRALRYPGLFLEIAAKIYNHGLTVTKWTRYIERERAAAPKQDRHLGIPPGMSTVIVWWKDYLNAAKVLGYDLKNPVFLLPKDLSRKHDEATRAAQALLGARRGRKHSEKEKQRLRTLTARYTYWDERWLIRPPLGAREIVAEGKALKHCVGGYADRHVAGTTTILFLRDKKAPGKSLVTIEMTGSHIVQIHGWDDERTPCKANPKQKSPRALYAGFLEPWLRWLEAGSKRDREGRPVLPKKRKKEGLISA